jgi:hypothetical protein
MTDELHEDEVIIEADRPLRMSPDCMRMLRKATGQSLTDILTNEDEDENRMQAIAFAELHRRLAPLGHLPDAAQLWERAGRTLIVMQAPENMPDPLGGEYSTTSQPSADSGE